jgi:hypothetical protein
VAADSPLSNQAKGVFMPEITIPTTSPFATASTKSADVKRLIAGAVEHHTEGRIDWKTMPASARPFNVSDGSNPIGYNRAWLIAWRAIFEVEAPDALVTLPARTADDAKSDIAWSKVISPMREKELMSWGLISVLTGIPESKVRKCFRATGNKKDLGLRTGKGGRFAYRDPELYLAHRKAEGAQVPVLLDHRPDVSELLNAKDADGHVVRFQRSAKGGAKKVG